MAAWGPRSSTLCPRGRRRVRVQRGIGGRLRVGAAHDPGRRCTSECRELARRIEGNRGLLPVPWLRRRLRLPRRARRSHCEAITALPGREVEVHLPALRGPERRVFKPGSAVASDRTARSGCVGSGRHLSEVLLGETNGHAALSHRGRDALDRVGPHVADREHTRQAGLEQIGTSFEDCPVVV
jgi:hypothetical protein